MNLQWNNVKVKLPPETFKKFCYKSEEVLCFDGCKQFIAHTCSWKSAKNNKDWINSNGEKCKVTHWIDVPFEEPTNVAST